MAKHKKPKPERREETAEEKTPAPPTEQPSSDPRDPSTPREIEERKRKLNALFWLRIGLAVAAGTIATFAFEGIEGEERRWASIVFMIAVFAGSIVIAKAMRMNLPRSDRKKLVTQGIGSYVFIYLFIWIVSYTVVNLPGGGLSPSFP